MASVEKVYPTAEELSTIIKNHNCPECGVTLKSESNLNFHRAKSHKKHHLLSNGNNLNRIYFCPDTSCIYNRSSHFKQLKFLKQHYLKVHSERNYFCDLCKKSFPTETARNRHVEFCDVIFKCCDCDAFYNCYETLKTHCRRKKHAILEKNAYKKESKQVNNIESNVPSSKWRLILPKPTNSHVIVVADTCEKSCQTEKSNQHSQETQTCLVNEMPQLTVETQTVGDYFTKQKALNPSLKNVKIQTVSVEPKTAACNTTFTLDDFELHMLHGVQQNSSSTQTVVDEPQLMYSSTSTHDSIHTDTSDLLKDTLDSNFFNCNMETQTDFDFHDELLKCCEDYSNMCTQTCEELLLGGIGLNDTHTQTVFDDLSKSVESQTFMSQYCEVPMSCEVNMTNMETQTDTYFKQIFEKINACL